MAETERKALNAINERVTRALQHVGEPGYAENELRQIWYDVREGLGLPFESPPDPRAATFKRWLDFSTPIGPCDG